MADDAIVTIDVSKFSTKRQQKLLDLLNDPKVQLMVNQITANAINRFVPMKSGALRASMEVTPTTISWGKDLKYARYQYGGEVYGPNLAGWLSKNEWGWRSRRGAKKHPMGRELGIPGSATLRPRFGLKYNTESIDVTFGYTTPGTKHHWDNLYTYQPKMKANQEITRLLKRICKQRGLNV